MIEFKPWPKIHRLHRDVVITEKIDGTNACVVVYDYGDGELLVRAQSRTRLLEPTKNGDNFGFAAWVAEHEQELSLLGEGHHYGEWYGKGIQRGYGLEERRFALFNPDARDVPDCCETVPVLARGTAEALNDMVYRQCNILRVHGSWAARGFKPAEGIIVYHTAARVSFKVLLENDTIPKGVHA